MCTNAQRQRTGAQVSVRLRSTRWPHDWRCSAASGAGRTGTGAECCQCAPLLPRHSCHPQRANASRPCVERNSCRRRTSSAHRPPQSGSARRSRGSVPRTSGHARPDPTPPKARPCALRTSQAREETGRGAPESPRDERAAHRLPCWRTGTTGSARCGAKAGDARRQTRPGKAGMRPGARCSRCVPHTPGGSSGCTCAASSAQRRHRAACEARTGR